MLYELLVDGEVVWSGLGNSPVHGLVRTLGSLAKREPPNLLDEEVQHLDVVVMAHLRSRDRSDRRAMRARVALVDSLDTQA